MKNILASKTVWFNVISFVLALVALPEFISILPATALPYIAVLTSVGNMVLRLYFTTQPLSVGAKSESEA